MQTPATPNIDINRFDNVNREKNEAEDDDEQSFYSAPPSRMFYRREFFIEISSFLKLATQQRDSSPSLFANSNNPEDTRIYNQAVLLNSLIRNMVNESGIQNSSSNESCYSNDTQVNRKKNG